MEDSETQQRPELMEMGHIQQTGQEEEEEERREKETYDSPVFNISFSQEGLPVTSHGPSPEEPCLLHSIITSRRENHTLL